MTGVTPASELQAFLAAHPEVTHVDAFLNDLNTVERGKRVDRAALEALYHDGMLLPGSMCALDVLGGTVQATGRGFEASLPTAWLVDKVANARTRPQRAATLPMVVMMCRRRESL